jgi:hypothetical protein
MSKTTKILIIVSSLIITFVVYRNIISPIISVMKFKHNFVTDDPMRYFWLIRADVELDDLGTGNPNFFVSGFERNWDQYFQYNLKGQTYIQIFEFMDLEPFSVKEMSVKYKTQIKFDDEDIIVLNDNSNDNPLIKMKFELPFKNTLSVKFDSIDSLRIVKDLPNCKAFFGQPKSMILCNYANEPLVFFKFIKNRNVIITFYSTRGRFFLS